MGAPRETFVAPEGWLDAIREEMEHMQLSQADLAKAVGTKAPQISKLLNGKGMRALADRVGDHLLIPPFIECGSAFEARTLLSVKTALRQNPRLVEKWLQALEEAL